MEWLSSLSIPSHGAEGSSIVLDLIVRDTQVGGSGNNPSRRDSDSAPILAQRSPRPAHMGHGVFATNVSLNDISSFSHCIANNDLRVPLNSPSAPRAICSCRREVQGQFAPLVVLLSLHWLSFLHSKVATRIAKANPDKIPVVGTERPDRAPDTLPEAPSSPLQVWSQKPTLVDKESSPDHTS